MQADRSRSLSAGVFDVRTAFTLITTALLVLPYATGALMFYFAQGAISMPPRTYMVMTAGLMAGNMFFALPRVSKVLICLLVLLAIRLADALVLARLPTTVDVDPRSFAAGSFVYAAALVFVLGDRNRFRFVAGLVALAVMTICVALNVWEWNYPGYFSTVEGRSAGWLQNANDSATAIVCMLGLLLALRPPKWLAVSALACSGIGVYFTLSRSGAIVWVAVGLAYAALNLRKSARGFLYVCALGGVAAVLVFKLVDFGSVLTDRNVLSRQEQLVGRGAVDINDTSRMDLLIEGIQGIIAKPIGGYGTYSSYEMPFRPHNMVVAAWLDSGIVGAILLVSSIGFALAGAIRARNDLLIGCVPLILFLPFSHNLLENKSYLFLWVALAGMLSFQELIRVVPQRQRSRTVSKYQKEGVLARPASLPA